MYPDLTGGASSWVATQSLWRWLEDIFTDFLTSERDEYDSLVSELRPSPHPP